MWIYLTSLWDIVCFFHLNSPSPGVAFTECVSPGLIESVSVALLAVFDRGRRWWNSQPLSATPHKKPRCTIFWWGMVCSKLFSSRAITVATCGKDSRHLLTITREKKEPLLDDSKEKKKVFLYLQ